MDEVEIIKLKKQEELLRKLGVRAAIDKPIVVTDASLKKFVSQHRLALLDCWAAWCAPCRMLSLTIDALAKEMHGKVVFGKLNVDENPATASRFSIFSIPTMLIFKDGKLEDRLVGALPKEVIKAALEKYAGG